VELPAGVAACGDSAWA